MAKKNLLVTLLKSHIGCTERQIACVKGLGLRKRMTSKSLKDTPEVRGMIRKVQHLVKVEEV
tara:strand:+ start:566 stop:751 length:186 start_codon:yes stop_codon:yes gene_type:complete